MATEAHEAAAGSSAGMPQLDISTWGNQIFWLLVALVVIYFVLSRVALPRIGAVLAERSGTITSTAADTARAAATEGSGTRAAQATPTSTDRAFPPSTDHGCDKGLDGMPNTSTALAPNDATIQ